MQNPDEYKALVKPLNDKARKTTRLGRQTLVPHKFTEEGDIPKDASEVVLSKLNLSDLRFLNLWRNNKWGDDKTRAESGLTPEQFEKTVKKLAYFKTEDARIKAMAESASPAMVLAKDVENLHTHKLQDTDHKSLDRIAKITGAFKTTEVNVTQNFLQLPDLSDEKRKEIKDFFDTIAVQENVA